MLVLSNTPDHAPNRIFRTGWCCLGRSAECNEAEEGVLNRIVYHWNSNAIAGFFVENIGNFG